MTFLLIVGMYTSGSMIFVDITNGAAKTITSLVFEFFWSIGLILLPIFNVFIEDWWKLYHAISLPTIFLIFLIKFVYFYHLLLCIIIRTMFFMKQNHVLNRHLPDSPRWLLRHGRIDEARQILIEGGTKNKRRVPINLEELLKTEYNSG